MAARTGGVKNLTHTFARILSFLGIRRGSYIAGGFLSTLEMASTLILPYLYEQLVAVVTSGGNPAVANRVLLLLAALLLFTPIICRGTYLQLTSAAYATGELRKAVFGHIMRLPVSAAMERKTGDYVTLLSNDVSRAGGSLAGFTVTSLFRFAMLFTVSAVILFLRDWRVAVLSIAFSAVAFVTSMRLNPFGRKFDRQAQEYASGTASFLIESVKGLPIIRVFSLKRRFEEHYRELCLEIKRLRVRYRTINGMIDGLISLFQFAAQPVGFIYGVYLVTRGEMDMGSLVFIAGVVGVMADAVKSLSTFIANIQSGLVSAQRVFKVLDSPVEDSHATLAPPDLNAEIAVEFKNVSFSYEGRDPVLTNFSATVKRGEVVALVGASGGGKTTLIKLLERFYDADTGSITVFGRPITELSRRDARELSAYVPQDSAVFDGTVLDNIALGRPGATRSEVETAAKKARIHDFITALPQGYDTAVGERGAQVSGGQRQRIAIARALLKDAPLLLLDEATSALDAESEAEVTAALQTLMEGRTTIVVAHRLSTIRNADRILVIENGAITEEGDHDALLSQRGAYFGLHMVSEGA